MRTDHRTEDSIIIDPRDQDSILCSPLELGVIRYFLALIDPEQPPTLSCGWTDCRGGHYWKTDGSKMRAWDLGHQAARYCEGPTPPGSTTRGAAKSTGPTT